MTNILGKPTNLLSEIQNFLLKDKNKHRLMLDAQLAVVVPRPLQYANEFTSLRMLRK